MIITTKKDIANFLIKADKIDLSKGQWEFTAKPYSATRSSQMNRLYQKWLREIAKKTNTPVNEVTNYSKFHFGCPILISESSEFEAFYGEFISNLVYEQALKSMEFISVTRLFNNKQMTEYMRGVEGYAMQSDTILTKPEFDL